MQRHLNLVDNNFQEFEKRVLPRFPFCYLTFKSCGEKEAKVFEITDISLTGMQVALKDGSHTFKKGGKIAGDVHWMGDVVQVEGEVQWTSATRLGVQFSCNRQLEKEISSFLDVERLAKALKPIHQGVVDLDLPSHLRYWLRSDGPVEVFVWRHKDGEIDCFQIILFENFVEWKDGVGLKTGRVMTKRDLDLPLLSEDEFVFQMDRVIDKKRLHLCSQLLQCLSPGLMDPETTGFLTLKCSA